MHKEISLQILLYLYFLKVGEGLRTVLRTSISHSVVELKKSHHTLRRRYLFLRYTNCFTCQYSSRCGQVEEELVPHVFETVSTCLYMLDSTRRLLHGICTRKGAGLSCSRSGKTTRSENFRKNPDSVPGTGASSVKRGWTLFPSPRCKRPETDARSVARSPRAR